MNTGQGPEEEENMSVKLPTRKTIDEIRKLAEQRRNDQNLRREASQEQLDRYSKDIEDILPSTYEAINNTK